MLTTLNRYIFVQLLPPFFISLAVLCFMFFTKEMLRLIELFVSKGVALSAVLKVVAHFMPFILVLTLPIACLIASLTTFSRLSYEKELVAIQAAGISLPRISVSIIGFSSLIAILTLGLSEWGQPWTNISLKRLALSLIRNQLTIALDTGVFNEPLPGVVIYVPDPHDGQRPKGVFISDRRDPSKPLIIVAKSYKVLTDPERHHLGLRLFHGAIHQAPRDITKYHLVTFEAYDLKMDLSQNLNMKLRERPSRKQILAQLRESNWTDTDALRRLMERYRDWAFPVSPLILGILGLPVGVLSKRSGRMGGFAVGLAVIVLFYLLTVLGEFLVTTRALHPLAGAWLPNIVILVMALFLFWKVIR